MARTLQEKALEELNRQASVSFRTPEIVGPNPANYGVFSNAYGQAEAARSQDPYFGGAELALMQLQSDNENRAYAAELEATRQAQLQAQDTAAYYGFIDKSMRDAADVPIGTYNVFRGDDGRAGVNTDPVLAASTNAMEFDTQAAKNYNERATGLKSVAEAGFAPPAADVTAFLRNPLEPVEGAAQYGIYETPAVAVERYGKDQGMTVEQQFTLEELKQAGALERAMISAQSGMGKWKAEVNPHTGVTTYTFTGTPEELAAQGLSPPTNPNAGARAPGASATQGSGNFIGIPGETVTSTYRDPAHNRRVGGVSNSFHMQRDAQGNPLARDSTPPAGMSMNDYHLQLQRLNPDKDVMNEGDHVHMEPRTRARTQARNEPPVRMNRITAIMQTVQNRDPGAKIEQQGNYIVITLSNGDKKTFDQNGNEVGG